MEYGDVIYDSAPTSTVQSLVNFQRQAAIACSGAYKHTNHRRLLNKPLATRRLLHKLILIFKIIRKIYPLYLYNHLKLAPAPVHDLRTSHEFVPRFTYLTISFRSFFPSTLRKCNLLSPELQNCRTVASFKRLLKNPQQNPYIKLNTGRTGTLLARLRMKLSPLNAHRSRYNFIPDPICRLCLTGSETTSHYFFKCPTHGLARTSLFNYLSNDLGLDTQNYERLLETIHFGKHIAPYNHKSLLQSVYKYLTDTNRFI